MNALIEKMRAKIEAELKDQVDQLDEPHTRHFHEMLTYHMGWVGDGSEHAATGKRIRPTLVLMTAAACGQDWLPVIPAASAVELIHNFSLIHDDIQDNSVLRRGRSTVWKKWGIPQAINAGDGLFVLANIAITKLDRYYPAETILNVSKIIQKTCLDLTRGQYMDISFEQGKDLTIDEYWTMIAGKTAALLAACTQIGAILSKADDDVVEHYKDYGHFLGLSYQIHDDYLGIWGNEQLTGKSTASDLVTKKMSLPILLGLEKNGSFAQQWLEGSIDENNALKLAEQLAEEGTKLETQRLADEMTRLAVQALRRAGPEGQAGNYLFDLPNQLLVRQT